MSDEKALEKYVNVFFIEKNLDLFPTFGKLLVIICL